LRQRLACILVAGWLWAAAPGQILAQVGGLGLASQELRALAGGRTRVVWVRHTGDGTDIFARGENLLLFGLDSDDGLGERQLVAGEASFCKPLITPSGRQVVFTNFTRQVVYVVNWDGSGLRELCSGAAAAAWTDPATRLEWVYVQAGKETGQAARNNPIWRVRLDDPAVAELVWNRTPVMPEGFQVSADGRRAVSLFPWPHFGVAALPNESVTELGEGCCASFAPDADTAFHLLGDHRHIMMYSLHGTQRWKVPLNRAPGVDGYEIYHPKWSNYSRILAICGPFRGQGGITAEIHLGRFNADLTAVEAWVRLTHNDKGDFMPDVWVEQAARLLRYTMSGMPVLVPANLN